MDTIGIDLHKRESQLCTITNDGELIEQRIVTTRERFTAVLGNRPPARILLESGPTLPILVVGNAEQMRGQSSLSGRQRSIAAERPS